MTRAADTPDVALPEEASPAPASLEEENATLRAGIAARDEIIGKLLERVAELERRLGLNSSNSGKPPSSDGLKKPPTSLRDPAWRSEGAPRQHAAQHPDAIVLPGSCPGCGEALGMADSVGHQGRQVFDLPDPQPLLVTEHRAHECRCRHCGARAAFPEAVAGPVQYDIAAVVAYLSAVQLLPEDRIAQLLHDLHRIDISAASIATMIQRKAAELADFAAAVGQAGAGQARRRNGSARRRRSALAAGGGDHLADLLHGDEQTR